MSIRRRTEKGIASMLISTLGNRVVHAIQTIILMRLMGPDQFGIIGFAVVFKEMVLLFSDWGISDAIIQKKGDQDLIASGLVLDIGRSLCFFAILFAAAPFASTFFSTPEVSMVIRISALMILLNPVQFVPRLKMTMDLRFTALAVISLIGTIVNAGVAIASAVAGYGYLSIVYGNVAGTLASLGCSWIAQPGFVQPWKATERGVRGILRFGYHLTLSGLVAWIYLNVDDLIVGKLLGKVMLGLYGKAYWIATLPSDTLGRILYGITFPVYCKVREDSSKLKKAFLEAYTLNVFFSLPAIIGIMLMSDRIVSIVFGPEWIGMTRILEVTCVVGLLRAIYGQANSIFKAVGRPDYYWKAAIVQAGIVVTLGLWATCVWGVFGMLAALILAMSWGFIVYGYLAFRKVLAIPVYPYLATLRPILAGTLAMALVTTTVERFATGIVSLVSVIGLSAAAYFATVYATGGRGILEHVASMAGRMIRRGP